MKKEILTTPKPGKKKGKGGFCDQRKKEADVRETRCSKDYSNKQDYSGRLTSNKVDTGDRLWEKMSHPVDRGNTGSPNFGSVRMEDQVIQRLIKKRRQSRSHSSRLVKKVASKEEGTGDKTSPGKGGGGDGSCTGSELTSGDDHVMVQEAARRYSLPSAGGKSEEKKEGKTTSY